MNNLVFLIIHLSAEGNYKYEGRQVLSRYVTFGFEHLQTDGRQDAGSKEVEYGTKQTITARSA